jgi:hypothetical protein
MAELQEINSLYLLHYNSKVPEARENAGCVKVREKNIRVMLEVE